MAKYICSRKYTNFRLLNPPVPSRCSPNLPFLDKDPEGRNTVHEGSLSHCLKTTCANHLIWTDVSVVSPDIPHCSKGEAYRQHQWCHMGKRARGNISKELTLQRIKDP